MKDPVEASNVGVELGLPVVRFDLGGERIPAQTERFDEGPRVGGPVCLGQGRHVRTVGAGGAVDLTEVFGVADPLELAGQTPRKHRHFLTQGCRGGGLSMGAGEHRLVPLLAGQNRNVVDKATGRREPDLLDSILDGEGIREVVDVLRRAENMNDIGVLYALTQVVLDSLHVVAGFRLDLAELLGIDLDASHLVPLLGRELTGQDPRVDKVNEPFDFDRDTGPVQGVL